jgi:hypothetical protein
MRGSGMYCILLINLIFKMGFVNVLFAQEEDYFLPDSLRNDQNDKVNFHFNTGTSIATDFGGGSAFTTFFAPTVTYQFNSKWRFSTGAMVSNTQLSGWTQYNLDRNAPQQLTNLQQQSVFFQAAYQVNEKLRIYGTVQQHLFSLNGDNSKLPFNLSGTTFDLGMDYEVSKGLHLGVQVRQSQGYTPFRSPFQSSFASPFSPFTTW